MCHIHKEKSIDFISDFSKAGKVNFTSIGAGTCNDHLWFFFKSDSFDFVIVDITVIIDSVGNDVIELSRKVYWGAMG